MVCLCVPHTKSERTADRNRPEPGGTIEMGGVPQTMSLPTKCMDLRHVDPAVLTKYSALESFAQPGVAWDLYPRDDKETEMSFNRLYLQE